MSFGINRERDRSQTKVRLAVRGQLKFLASKPGETSKFRQEDVGETCDRVVGRDASGGGDDGRDARRRAAGDLAESRRPTGDLREAHRPIGHLVSVLWTARVSRRPSQSEGTMRAHLERELRLDV